METKSGVLKAVVIIVAFCRSIIVVEIVVVVEFSSSLLSPPVNGKNFRKKASPSSGPPRSLRWTRVKPITKSIPMKSRAAIERTIS